MKTEIDTISRVSPLKIPTILWASWNTEEKPPSNLMGEPSTVKSEMVCAVSKEIAQVEKREFLNWNRAELSEKMKAYDEPSKYFVFADVRASETDVGEMRLQNMETDKSYITYKYALLYEVLSKKDAKGVLFFDEMNVAPALIKAQFYKVLNDKAIGDLPLSNNVMCVCAGNEAKHSRIVSRDTEPLVLRRGNYFLKPLTTNEFLDWANVVGLHRWVIGYNAFQQGDTHNIKYDLPDGVGQPCPRTWTRLSQILKANPDMSLDDIELIATGWIGQGVARKFTAFVKSAQDINLDVLLANPEKIKTYEEDAELSLMYAIISGVVDKYRQDKKVLPKILDLAAYMERVEIGTFMLRSAKYADERNFAKNMGLVDAKLMNKIKDKYGKFIIQH